MKFDTLEDARKFLLQAQPLVWRDSPIRKDGLIKEEDAHDEPRPETKTQPHRENTQPENLACPAVRWLLSQLPSRKTGRLVALSSGDDRRVDDRPCRNIDCGVVISISGETTGNAGEQTLRFTVSFFNMSTARTFLAGIFRVNFKQLHAKQFCFIGKKLFELVERPVEMLCPLAFANRSGLPYAFQVFNGNGIPKCLRLLDNVFADYVIGVALKAFLFTRQFLQMSFSGFCSLRLQSGAKFLVALALLLYLFTAETFASGVGSKIGNTQINSENFVGFRRSQVFDVAGNKQEKLATMQNEVGFTFTVLQHIPLSLTTNKRQIHSSFESPKIDLLLWNFESENPVVECNCAVLTENSLFLLADFVGIGDFRNSADCNLSREFERFPDVIVGSVMQGNLSELLLPPSNSGKAVASSIHGLKSLPQNYCLFAVGQESYLSNEFHKTNILKLLNKVKDGIPPPAKAGGLLPYFL
jgi:hypothetical protein